MDFEGCPDATHPGNRPSVVVMGVSGSGKSTVGAALAAALTAAFVDGDGLHPAANIAKMSSGQALTDADRWPWLAAVGRTLARAETSGAVVACSALRRSYRDAIRAEAPEAFFVHLTGSAAVLLSRLAGRRGHFMPVGLLDSQLATLEPLGRAEHGLTLDIDQPVANLVSAAEAATRAARGCR